ncbi:MAG: metallophosphoesterase family protein [Roseibacillus sp.]|nr:metallophosphoesterase family protein [Roseibacillus sp.]
MRYAIFSDIYGNRQAWEALLEDLDRQEIDMPICLGDVAGYGPGTPEILCGLRARTGNTVLGDFDAAVAGMIDVSLFDEATRQAIEWTRAHLDREALAYLAGRPLALETGGVLFVHGECVKPGRYRGVPDHEAARENFAATEHRVTFLGHAGTPGIFRLRKGGKVEEMPAEDGVLSEDYRFLVKVGSVGEPASAGDVSASYLIYDNRTQEVFFRRVPFNAHACRADLLAAGLALRPWCLERVEDGLPVAPTPVAVPAIALRGDMVVSVAPVAAPIVPAAMARSPEPVRRSSGVVAWLALVSVIVMAAAIGVLVFRKMQEDRRALAASENRGLNPSPGPASPPVPAPVADPPVPAPVEEEPDSIPELAGAPGELQPEPEMDDPSGTAVVAIVNDPPTSPPDPGSEPPPEPDPGEPEPAPKPVLPKGRAPIPPEPANVASLTPFTSGLIFYAPFDEESTEFQVRDLSGGERDLDATSGSPGMVGRIGLACRLVKENGSEAMLSPAKPLPEIKDITIAFWFRRPDSSLQAPPEPGAPAGMKALPDATLVGLNGFCEVRVAGDQIEADLRTGEATATMDLPKDLGWHHFLVEHVEGKTSIWLDHRVQSEVVAGQLGAVPAGGAAVQVGSKDADFCIDEAAIWSRRFTADERCVLYRFGRFDTAIMTPPRAIAHWGFDNSKLGTRVFSDGIGAHPLGAFARWKPVQAIAPNPVPLILKGNAVAAQVSHIAESKDEAGSFEMKADVPFTYEGWVKVGRLTAGTLGGTISAANEEKAAGWRLALSPAKSGKGFLAFIYDTGLEKMQAVADNVPIYDGLPHHFAVVWNPRASGTHGSMEIFLDNKMVATALVPLSSLGEPSSQHFRVAVGGSPVVLDELRFSSDSLKPSEFLTKGEERSRFEPPPVARNDGRPVAPVRPGESPFQRAARELQERKAEEKAERERRRAEEARRRREGFRRD